MRSGPLVAWATAWRQGRVSTDDVLDAVRSGDGRHSVVAADGTPSTLLDLLAAWRRAPGAIRLVLPVAGDVRGVPGPAGFRAAALETGEAAFAAGLGVVPIVTDYEPSSAPPSVVWRCYEVADAPADHVQLSEAQYELTTAVRDCATALASAEVSGAAAPVADELRRARRAGERLNLPPGWPPRAVALLAQAERTQAVLDLALLEPVVGAVSRAGFTAHQDALRPLVIAVRRARLAAHNAGE